MKQATTLTSLLIRQQIKPLLFILGLSCLISLQLEDALGQMSSIDDSGRWMLQLSMGLTDLLQGVMLFLVLSWGIPKVHALNANYLETRPFNTPYLGSLLAEYMRMLALILVGGLMLLIPGLIAYVLLMFVPYIAIFSKRYRNDEVNAVSYSYHLTKKFFWPILGVFVISTAVQVGLEFLPHMVPAFFSWTWRIIFSILSFGVAIWTFSYMFTLFERAVTEDRHELNV